MTDHPTPPRRGRGQPRALTGARLDALLTHLAAGLTIRQAADAVGITRATVYNTRTRDPDADRAVAAATATGKAARATAKAARTPAKHGTEACYTHHGCRRPECTAAASAARTRRRSAPAEAPPTPPTTIPARTTLALLAAATPRAAAS